MLSLVEYDNSDSEEESSAENVASGIDHLSDVEIGSVKIMNNSKEEDNDLGKIFESLPEPHLNSVADGMEEDDDEYLKKREVPTEKPKKQPIKISIPSLSEFDSDDEETPTKKPRMDSKSCGLFALLPPPKTTPVTAKHFVPNVVKRNINKTNKIDKKIIPADSNKNNKERAKETGESDDEVDMEDLPDTFDDEMWQKVCGRKEKRSTKPVIEESVETSKQIQLDPDVQKPYDGLDNQAFKELMGAANKRRDEKIDIVEINEDEILSDKKIWMTKSLTDPEMAAKYVVKDPVNDTCRRKHHITYLAQQAKANEQELQNQWASSRFTRQKTQAKYGF